MERIQQLNNIVLDIDCIALLVTILWSVSVSMFILPKNRLWHEMAYKQHGSLVVKTCKTTISRLFIQVRTYKRTWVTNFAYSIMYSSLHLMPSPSVLICAACFTCYLDRLYWTKKSRRWSVKRLSSSTRAKQSRVLVVYLLISNLTDPSSACQLQMHHHKSQTGQPQ
jgi:hypothetical protein